MVPPQPVQAPVQQQPPPRTLTRRELIAISERESNRRRTEERRALLQRRRDIITQVRNDVDAYEHDIAQACATIPASLVGPWPGGDPVVVDDFREMFQSIRGLVMARDERHADELADRTQRCRVAVDAYVAKVQGVTAEMQRAERLRQAYNAEIAAQAPNTARQLFLEASEMLRQGARPAADIRAKLNEFMVEVQRITARGTANLQALQGVNQAHADTAAQRYFDLGRARLGHLVTFYSTPFDGSYGKFGAEWRIEAVDPSLGWMAREWVFHAHCRAVFADEDRLEITGFTINGDAAHIKQKVNERALGMSISINSPGEFNRVEARDRDRFLRWAATSVGRDVLRRRRRGE